jgi:hypothetical protein
MDTIYPDKLNQKLFEDMTDLEVRRLADSWIENVLLDGSEYSQDVLDTTLSITLQYLGSDLTQHQFLERLEALRLDFAEQEYERRRME